MTTGEILGYVAMFGLVGVLAMELRAACRQQERLD